MQNAIKVFGNFPPALVDILKATDPSTVTQHGLYMRNLTDQSPLEQDMLPQTEQPGAAGQSDSSQPAAKQDAVDPQSATGVRATSQSGADDSGQGSAASPSQQQAQEVEQRQGHGKGWGRGRVTLLGDSAHATLPNGALTANV